MAKQDSCRDYLLNLSVQTGIDFIIAEFLAELLGSEELFDGLPNIIEEFQELGIL